ncbi:Uncharacterised protein [Mycobacteroides abscessus subsp. abscessus]|nr:Uncharacterised protein [Mycobacteroides abscessus subsp. abscessus]
MCGLLRSLRSLLNGCLLYGCLGGRLCVGLPGPVVGQRFSVCGALARGLRAHVLLRNLLTALARAFVVNRDPRVLV